MANERGLVISCPLTIVGTSVHVKTTALDPQELRSALLFWDKLDFPENNLLYIGLDRDAQFLADAGILKRTHIHVVGSGNLAQGVASAHVHAYRILDGREPGVWSLGRGENSVSFPQQDLESGRGVLVSLHQAIPVPDKDVPIQDILEFKTKRAAELLALRYHLESIYQKVITAGDGELALNSEIERLQNSISNHIKASRESRFPFRLTSNLSANLNLLQLGIALLTSPLSVPAMAIGTFLKIEVGSALKGHTAVATPFQYISSYNDELL